MAIVQISKIQHRRGVNTDLPQLASAELGWSVDTRQLYIGNGTLEEGAPIIGNTEILTQYSDILALTEAYTYKGLAAGYEVVAGDSRSFQQKLDDFASVRDFGALGDGVTDDTQSINRALYELYCREVDVTEAFPNAPQKARRTLFFPGGVYKVSGLIKIPSWARLQGDGISSTVILQTNDEVSCVAVTADSKQQTGVNIGAGGATTPVDIEINDLTFKTSIEQLDPLTMGADNGSNIFEAFGVNGLTFNRVGFVGVDSSLTSAHYGGVCFEASAPSNLKPTKNVTFNGCSFSTKSFAFANTSTNVYDVVFANCVFDSMFTAFKLGQNYSITSLRVLSSNFDNIANSAINTTLATNIVSAFNHYGKVGNNLIPAGTPVAPVIVYNGAGCFSVGDTFDRADDSVYPRVLSGDLSAISLLPSVGVNVGNRTLGTGILVELDAAATPTATNITLDNTAPGASISYTVTRTYEGNTRVRSGTFNVAHTGTVVSYSDEYNETSTNGVSVGLVLSASYSSHANAVVINYTLIGDTPGEPAKMKYSVDTHKF